MNVDVLGIVENWLREHGYDGLVYPEEECGCSVSDLAPCGGCGITHLCQAAYLHSDGSFYLGKEKSNNEWIPVEERLPERGQSVLTIVQYRECPAEIAIGERASDLDGSWYGPAGYVYKFRVTHWMPLPSLPEAEEATDG